MNKQQDDGVLSSFLREKRFAAALPYLRGRVLDIGCGEGNLASFVEADLYVGMDINVQSLVRAKRRFPHHQFLETMPEADETFDTVVALAVIEHVSDPVLFLKECKRRLRQSSGSRLVLSTPCPRWALLYHLGVHLGLFSKQAQQEHKDLLNLEMIEFIGKSAGLILLEGKHFLLGANQLAVFGMPGTDDVLDAIKPKEASLFVLASSKYNAQ